MLIDAKTTTEFEEQFRKFLETAESSLESVVYFFEVANPIPRVAGKSRIIYIGQTKKTFRARYQSNQNIRIEMDCFENFYRKAIDEYGPINIRIKKSTDPVRDEATAFREYRKTHLEFPPLNRTIPHRMLNEGNI